MPWAGAGLGRRETHETVPVTAGFPAPSRGSTGPSHGSESAEKKPKSKADTRSGPEPGWSLGSVTVGVEISGVWAGWTARSRRPNGQSRARTARLPELQLGCAMPKWDL